MSTLATDLDFKQLFNDIYDHGVTNLPNIHPVRWADELDEDVGLQFIDGLKVEGGEVLLFVGGADSISNCILNVYADSLNW